MSSRRQQPWLRLLDVVVGVVAGAAVAVLVQNVADKKRAEKKERREGDDSSSMVKMTAAILRLEDKLGRTCDHIDAWLDDAVYDATTNDTYLDAHQTSGIAAREDAGGVVAGLAPVSAAAAAAAVAQPKQDDGKLSMMAMCQDFDAGIEGPDSLQAARTLLDIGEPAAALLLHDNESRQVEPVVMCTVVMCTVTNNRLNHYSSSSFFFLVVDGGYVIRTTSSLSPSLRIAYLPGLNCIGGSRVHAIWIRLDTARKSNSGSAICED